MRYLVRRTVVHLLSSALVLLLGVGNTWAAPPANDACSTAEALPLEPVGECGTLVFNGTTVDATNTTVTESSCTPTAADVWYTVNTGTANVLYVNTVNGAASDLNVEIYTGPCGALSLLQCGVLPDGQVDLSGLLYNSSTITVRVYHAGAPGPFGICFSGEASCTLAQYTVGCTNPTYGGDIDGLEINGFSFTGDGCQGSTSAVDRTAQSIRFTAGDNGTFTVTGSFPFTTYVGMWMDYNDDLVYDASEFSVVAGVLLPSQGNTIDQPFFIQAGAAAVGTHRMRLRVLPGFAMTADQACAKFEYGETHDYTAIVAPNPCADPDIATNGCDPQAGHYIHELQVADLVQGGTLCENSNFRAADYTNLEVNVEPGNSYAYVVSTFDHQSIPAADHYVGWWMDLNDDGDFDDAGEFIGSAGPSTGHQLAGTFAIPITASAGTHRLRVRYVYQEPQGPGTACTPYANSETQDYTAVVALPPGICQNQYTTGCSSGGAINNIAIADLNETNTGCTGGTLFDDRTATTIHLFQGQAHPFTLTTTFHTGSSATAWWIDLNDDEVFSASEYMGGSLLSSSLTHTGTVTIPADAALGAHRLRVRSVRGTSPGAGDACTVYARGETHDYTVDIAAAYCTTNLYTANNCTGNSFAIDDISIADLEQTGTGCTGVLDIADYTNIEVQLLRDRDIPFTIVHPNSPSSNPKYTGWWIDLNNNLSFDDPGEFIGSSVSPAQGDMTGVVNVPASAPLGAYRMRVRLANEAQGEGTACELYPLGETHDYTAVIVEDPPYCTLDLYATGPNENCNFGDNIDDISVADLVQTGTGCSENGTSDHTGITVNMEVGTTYPFTIQSNWSPDEYTGWWVDLNDDGDFDDADEFIGSSGPSTSPTITGTVSIPANAPVGEHRMRVRLVFDNAQTALTSCTQYTYGEAHDYTVHISGPPLLLDVHAVLDGPYDASTGLMNDALRSLGTFPLTDPYPALGYGHTGSGNGGAVDPAVLAVAGNDAVVDWVVVELRDGTLPETIVASRSALLQRDGDVVDLDGLSSLGFQLPPGNYHVAIRHKNHLGCMTASPLALSITPVALDLADPGTTTYGTAARTSILGNFPAEALWAGDVSFDGVVLYTGADNDRDKILEAIGGVVPTSTIAGYHAGDVNMDGQVKYTGLDNDRDAILQNIGGVVPTSTRVEQMP